MILNCPECSTRYLLSSAAIGEEGRTLRCAKCSHEWFQEPETEHGAPYESLEAGSDNMDDLSFMQRDDDVREERDDGDDDSYGQSSEENKYEDEDPDAESFSDSPDDDDKIPEAVKPLPRLGADEEKKGIRRSRPPQSLQARMVGYGAALMIFILLIVGGMLFKQTIVTAWPPSAAIYKIAGMPVVYKGEDLVMESLSATIVQNESGQEILVLKGRVINLTERPIDVPNLMAVLRSTNGEDGASWIIEPPVDVVEPGASFAFTSDYPNIPRGVGSVNLIFVPTVIGTREIKPSGSQG